MTGPATFRNARVFRRSFTGYNCPMDKQPQDLDPVAGEGVTQEAVDAAEQELETPEDTTNEG